jgi:hypothetical protein
VTVKRVPDNFEVKQALATKEYPNSGFKFEMPKPHVFRNTDPGSVLKLNQPDFNLKTTLEPMDDPHGLSAHNPLPKFWADKEQLLTERANVAEGLAGKQEWHLYHKKLPLTHVPLAQNLKDKLVTKETSLNLARDKWESPTLLLARTINDQHVIGKPPIQLYYPVMKPEHKNQ